MKSASFERFSGWLAILTGVSGILYAIAFVLLKDNLLSALFLMLGGIFTSGALIGLYQRLREESPGFGLWALLLGLWGAFGSAVHGGFDLSNVLHPPATPNLDLPNSIDPRGLLTFGLTSIALFVFAWLIRINGRLPGALGSLGYLSAALMLILYLGRLIVLDATSMLIVIPAVLEGFLVNPIWYIWLGLALLKNK